MVIIVVYGLATAHNVLQFALLVRVDLRSLQLF